MEHRSDVEGALSLLHRGLKVRDEVENEEHARAAQRMEEIEANAHCVADMASRAGEQQAHVDHRLQELWQAIGESQLLADAPMQAQALQALQQSMDALDEQLDEMRARFATLSQSMSQGLLEPQACLPPDARAAEEWRALEMKEVSDFPVIRDGGVCLGFTTRARLESPLQACINSGGKDPEEGVQDDGPAPRIYALFAKAGMSTACVVSETNEFKGMISRRNLINTVRRLED